MNKPSRKNRSKKTDQVHEESLTIKDGVDKLEQEGDGDYVTKAYVYEMMKMQESLQNKYKAVQLSFYICF